MENLSSFSVVELNVINIINYFKEEDVIILWNTFLRILIENSWLYKLKLILYMHINKVILYYACDQLRIT